MTAAKHIHTPLHESMVGAFAQCVRHPNASPLTYRGTNTWVLAAPGDVRCVLVDPGPADSAYVRRDVACLAQRGLDVAAIVLTHVHPDHAGCAHELADEVAAPVLCLADGSLAPGPLAIEGVTLAMQVLPLPGHSSDSAGLYVADDDFIVTGDVLFAQSSTMVCWPDGRLDDYLASLDALASFIEKHQVTRLLTAHGPVIEHPLERIDRARRHRLQRLQQVVTAVRSGIPARAEELVDAIYNDTPPELFEGAVRSVNAQLRYAFDKGILQEHC